jgi:hypothetical protein
VKYLFLDSNVHLHFNSFDQIEWDRIVDDEVTLVFTIPMLNEVSNLKDMADTKKLRERAGKRAKKLFDLIGSTQDPRIVREKVRFRDPPIDPTSAEIRELRLNPDVRDDAILASALSFIKSEGIELDAVRVVSTDLGLAVKCRHRSLICIQPPDEERLGDDDDVGKEISKLRAVIAQYESRMPHLVVGPDSGAKFIELVRKPRAIMDDHEIEEIVMQKGHLFDLPSPAKWAADMVGSVMTRDDYEKAWRQYLQHERSRQQEQRRSFSLALNIENKGTASASEVRIATKIAGDVAKLRVMSPIRPEADEPKLPAVTVAENFKRLARYGTDFGSNPIFDPELLKHQWQEVDNGALCNIRRIPHHDSQSTKDLWIEFKTEQDVRQCTLVVAVICNEMPNPKRVEIGVKFIDG